MHRNRISPPQIRPPPPRKPPAGEGPSHLPACDGKCLSSSLQAVPSAGQSSSSRYGEKQLGASSPPLPGPLLLVLPPKPGPGHRGSSPETLPPAPKLDSCSFLTETAHVFMGLFYVKSWRISGETHACKKGKKKPLRW